MKRSFLICIIACTVLLVSAGSEVYCQDRLDSTRSDILISLLDQFGTPFIAAAKSYQVEKKKWPIDSAALVLFALQHKEKLVDGRYKKIDVRVDTSNHLMLHFELKPFKIPLGEDQASSNVTSLSGTIRVLTLTKEPDGVTLFISVDAASILLPDESKRSVHNYEDIHAKVIHPRY